MSHDFFRGGPTRRGFLGAAAASGLAPALGIQPAAAQTTPRRGGTLNWLLDPEPPLLTAAIQTAGPTRAIGPKINEGLLDFDWRPVPRLATEWQVSPDGLDYAFKIRQGVAWHDGKALTAADVAFSILFLKQYHPNGRGTFANVQEAKATDASTVRLRLSAPAPYLLRALAANESPILPRHLFEVGDQLANPAHNAPVGTGPFVFKEWIRGSHILLERNANYWDGPRPYLDRIVAKFIADPAARAAALEAGTVDLAGDSPIPLSDLERFKSLAHIRLETRGYEYSGDLNQLVFNLDNPYLSHLAVRQAIAHAIDKEAILKLIWYGYGEVAHGPIIPSQRAFYAPDLPRYAHDPKRAEELLDQAGFKRRRGRAFRADQRFPALRPQFPARRRIPAPGAGAGGHPGQHPGAGLSDLHPQGLHRARFRFRQRLAGQLLRPHGGRAAAVLVPQFPQGRALFERGALCQCPGRPVVGTGGHRSRSGPARGALPALSAPGGAGPAAPGSGGPEECHGGAYARPGCDHRGHGAARKLWRGLAGNGLSCAVNPAPADVTG